jgi:hypothetical protein
MRTILMRQIVIVALLFGASVGVAFSSEESIAVWKSPTCGCCQKWVDYLSDNGFDVVTHDVEDVTPYKRHFGVTNPKLYSCHTALIDGYVIEGHVPASDIRRLLRERPKVVGLTAPGMPQMSPGMHSVEPKDYDVLQFDKRQQLSVFSRY